jgi:hypothetical protein
MLPHTSETLGMFVPPLPIILYSFLVPMLDAFTEVNDLDCYNNTTPQLLHFALFAGGLTFTGIHAISANYQWYQLRPTYFQRTATTAFARTFYRGTYTRGGFVLSVLLQMLVVAFWSVFLGPEPLSCIIPVTDSDFAGFEVTRAMVFAMTGACLFLLLFIINFYGRNSPMPRGAGRNVEIPPPDTVRLNPHDTA